MPARLYAVSDLHGMREETIRALAKALLITPDGDWVAEDVKLVVMGDCIDRGPDSKGVTEDLLKWTAQAPHFGSEVRLLMGNHEHMVLAAHHNEELARDWWTHGGKQCLDSFSIQYGPTYQKQYSRAVVEAIPAYFLELESYHLDEPTETLFVHGGVHHLQRLADLDKSVAHLWLRPQDFLPQLTPEILLANYGAKRVIFGHTPVLGGPTQYLGGLAICIDTGSCFKGGRVTVVELTGGVPKTVAVS